MTKHEAVIFTLYTGIAFCDFRDVHKYADKLLGGPIFTHEYANKKIWEELKEKVKPEFINICKEVTD